MFLPDTPDPLGGGGGAPAPTPTPTPPPAPPAKRMFDQDEVNAIAAREADEAKRKAIRDIAAEFGMSPTEAAAEFKRLKEAEDARKTDEQRRADELTAREAAAQAKETAAAARERSANIRLALATAGCVGKDDLADAQALIEPALAADADDAAITAAVEALKARRAALFTGQPAPAPTPHTDPGSRPPAQPQGGSAKERARARLAEFGIVEAKSA